MVRARSDLSAPSGNAKALVIGVSMPPGDTEFTRIPRRPYSTARARVRDSTAPLDAQYAADQA